MNAARFTPLVYCREGFESEAAAELAALIARPVASGSRAFVHASAGSERLDLGALVFARQLIYAAPAIALESKDRAGQIIEALRELDLIGHAIFLETPDTTLGREVLGFCGKFQAPLEIAMKKAGVLTPAAPLRLHALFESSARVTLGFSEVAHASPWLMGIPRLRFPRGAPSRSTLKLDEAISVFISASEQQRLFKPGMRAVDLGAAPGGWTYQLTQRGLKVDAVDNGPMDPALLHSGLVKHWRADGFKFRPKQKVEWLVCDMVETPLKVAELIAHWLQEGLAQRAIFNLKLPMKKRSEALARCRQALEPALSGKRILRFKQLYHDREEVTGCVI